MSTPKKIPLTNTPAAWNNPFNKVASDQLPPGLESNPEPTGKPKRGRVVLRRETAHRGGKTVIIVHDFDPHIGNDEIENISRQLRKTCGCGGTVKDRAIELQGDQPAKIRAVLEAAGFRVTGIS
jgi:translation initiation factor 1